MAASLQRIVLDYRNAGLVVRVLYRSSLDGPNPGTARRRREVTDLCRSGLEQALAAQRCNRARRVLQPRVGCG